MRMRRPNILSTGVLLALLSAVPIAAQLRVDASKRATLIPKACQSVVPASIEGQVDVAALVKEAICKGAGDMLDEYSYLLNSSRRVKDKKGKTKESTTTYEVFIPTLKSGTHTRGILVVTSRDGIPVPPNELEKERLQAGERLGKEEDKIAREAPVQAEPNSDSQKGMPPLGTYNSMAINRTAFGMRRGGARLAIHTFLKKCDLTLARHEQNSGRETLVFNFGPRPDAQFNDEEKYIAQINGEIWIDAQDRIVTRLIGWPASAQDKNKSINQPSADQEPPAVYVDMMRLKEGIWLPHVVRINGVDYPKLFDGITEDSSSSYSNYVRFSTEIKDVKVNPPNN
ncbi:MAG TPA: hypothetical protein VHE60_05850 [Pyrinomonadaceae bacterium]|nr:hypothetical protein [Pyrinomonadaceae bacterium]